MDSHREMRVDMSLLVSTELRYIKERKPRVDGHTENRYTAQERRRKPEKIELGWELHET